LYINTLNKYYYVITTNLAVLVPSSITPIKLLRLFTFVGSFKDAEGVILLLFNWFNVRKSKKKIVGELYQRYYNYLMRVNK